MKRTTAYNIGMPQWGLTCFYDTFVVKVATLAKRQNVSNKHKQEQHDSETELLYSNFFSLSID
jgi:hypothetical protein